MYVCVRVRVRVCVCVTSQPHNLYVICDRLYENRPSSHLVVIRETLV